MACATELAETACARGLCHPFGFPYHFSQFLVVDRPGRVAPLVADNRVGVALSGGMIAVSC